MAHPTGRSGRWKDHGTWLQTGGVYSTDSNISPSQPTRFSNSMVVLRVEKTERTKTKKGGRPATETGLPATDSWSSGSLIIAPKRVTSANGELTHFHLHKYHGTGDLRRSSVHRGTTISRSGTHCHAGGASKAMAMAMGCGESGRPPALDRSDVATSSEGPGTPCVVRPTWEAWSEGSCPGPSPQVVFDPPGTEAKRRWGGWSPPYRDQSMVPLCLVPIHPDGLPKTGHFSRGVASPASRPSPWLCVSRRM